jgi:CAAX prenyl protease-like protein
MRVERQPEHSGPAISDDWAYIIPMGAFLVLTQAGAWWPDLYVLSYVGKTVLVAALLVWLWPRYTKIDWSHAWLGVLVGLIGVVQWVGMEELLLSAFPGYPRLSAPIFDPDQSLASPAARWMFIGVRWAGAALVVPVMEELFWRDFIWRTIIAGKDFKRAAVGAWSWAAFLIVPLIFATVHTQWLTAVVWALMIGLLLVKTRSLGACVIAHGVTNFLLGAFVLYTRNWYFW